MNNISILTKDTHKTYHFYKNMSKNLKWSIGCGIIDGDGSWLNFLSCIFDGLYTSIKINNKGNCYVIIGKDGTKKLLKHIKKHNLPVMERKWC